MMGGVAGPGGGAGGMRGGPRPSLRTAFSVLRNPTYRYLWFSSIGSFLGMQMQMIAGAWLAWELSQSFTVVGIISVAMGLPMLCLSLIGGAVADRVNKRQLSILTQSAMAAIALTTALLVVTDLISVQLLFVLGLVQGTAFAFGMPARQPLMAAVVGPENLMSAMALGSAAMNGTRLLGPAIAGALIGLQGVGLAYFVQAAMYLAALSLLFAVPAHYGAAVETGEKRGVAQDIGAGLRYVFTERTLRLLVLMGFIPALFAMPYQMLLAGFVESDLGQGPDAFGFLQTVAGTGALAGSIAVASLVGFSRKPLLQLGMGLTGGAGLVLLGLASMQWGYAGAVGATLILGFTLTSYQTLNMTMLMHTADRAYYGRVMSIMMLTFSAMPLMAAPLGLVADAIGAANLFVVLGITVAVALVLVSLGNPQYVFAQVEAPAPGGPPAIQGMPGRPGAQGMPSRDDAAVPSASHEVGVLRSSASASSESAPVAPGQ